MKGLQHHDCVIWAIPFFRFVAQNPMCIQCIYIAARFLPRKKLQERKMETSAGTNFLEYAKKQKAQKYGPPPLLGGG